jgi:uncharacterized cupredoxin-like copper-binding protein
MPRRSRPITAPRLAIALALALGVAACGGDDAAGDVEPSAVLEVEGGEMYYEPDRLVAIAGEVTVTLDNVGIVEHDFLIEEMGDLDVVGMVDPGQSATGTVELEPGTYTVYCSVPGHRNAGMQATLEVR